MSFAFQVVVSTTAAWANCANEKPHSRVAISFLFMINNDLNGFDYIIANEGLILIES
ncbi:DUF3787 domain-containing protein [Francisella sp. Scap27]|nr:DUF3787 domain-containing protein [Francisella sp. Scap27]